MTTTTRTVRSTICRLALAAAFLLATPALWLPGEAGAQSRPIPRGQPISRLFAAPKVSGCIVPAAVISISPGSISFPTPVAAGACSGTTQSFTVTNTGTKTACISALYLTPPGDPDPFSLSESCYGTCLAPGQSCGGTVQFCPYSGASPGPLSQQLVVYHDAGSNAITLSGTVASAAPVPVFTRSPSSLSFGSILLGLLSPVQYVTVQNVGGAPFTVSSAATAAPFGVVSNTCGTVGAGASCQIGVQYTAALAPTSTEFGTLTITHTAPGSPATVSLSATSVAKPGVTVVTAPPLPLSTISQDLYMDPVEVGFFAYNDIYLTNLSVTPVTVNGTLLGSGGSGNFFVDTDGCTGQVLTVGQSCTVTVGYDATLASAGTDSDTFDFDTDAGIFTSNVFIDVYPPYPYISVTPSSADFGTLNVGSTSACQDFQVRNDGMFDALITLNGPYYGDYATGSCTSPGPVCPTGGSPFTLTPSQSCWVSLAFSPSFDGYSYDYLDIADGNSWWGYVSGATLFGYGLQPGPRITVDQYALSFGTHPVGVAAPNQSVLFTNVGDAPLTVSSIALVGGSGFSLVGETCTSGSPLAPMATCTATFGFTAPAASSYYDYATIVSDAVDNPTLYVDLDGSGSPTPAPSADFYPMSLDFGNVVGNTTSPVKTVSFANTGSAPMTITDIVSGGGDFTVSHDCPLAPATLAAGACCTISSQFKPTVAGPQSTSIQVTDDAAGSPHLIPIQGVGVPPPSITPSPTSLTVPDQIIDTSGGPYFVSFTNTGLTDIFINFLDYLPPGGDFAAYPPGAGDPKAARVAKRSAPGPKAGLTARLGKPKAAAVTPCFYGPLLKGESCYAEVYFTPTVLGLRTGMLSLDFSGGIGSPFVVALAGTGIPVNFPAITVSASEVDFNGVVVGTTSSRGVVVTSTGSGPLAILGVRTSTPDFGATSDCPASLAPGSVCTVTVTCSPTALQRYEADLYIDHDASGGFTNVHLLCTGADKPVPKIEVLSRSLGFANQTLGTSSAAQPVVIRSVGSAPLAITNVGATTQFGASSNCPPQLAPGLTCNAFVTFSPTAAGRQRGTLDVGSNDPDVPDAKVLLNGTGCRPFSVQAGRRGLGLCNP